MLSGIAPHNFDPSGHFSCALVAQAGHASYYLFLIPAENPKEKELSKQKYLFLENEMALKIRLVAFCLFALFQAHACYSLFFTALLYHSPVEILIGGLFGLGIVAVTYEADIVANSLVCILSSPFYIEEFSK